MQIAIIGLGLIGGSIGLGIKAANHESRVIGIPRREETIQEAIRLGAIDEGTTDLAKGVAQADLIFVCTPINLIIPVITEIAPHLKKGTIVSDVGSTKQEIVAKAEKLLPKGCYFVGGHPMAGKETTKLSAAEAALFKDRKWLITKTSRTSSKALEKLEMVIGWLGGLTVNLDPKTHDLVVAAISHLPLVLAAALVNTVAAEEQKELMGRCAASGFRDTTRVASGDPILGVDMFSTNQKAVMKMIKSFKKSLATLENMIRARDNEGLNKQLSLAKAFRDQVYINKEDLK